ncbi:MAG: tRNA 2-thiouridine(34) synthase MnmA [Verrucomicrobia bacterium]|nr:tRNA 2-thiouridine(34) synthase MnmA [Verrucomicrobiota bacterium]
MTRNGKTRIVIGMSGGVDSSTAAALLVEQGYDVIGVTLKLWKQDCFSASQDLFKCCGSRAAADVRTVCDHLGIPFHLIDEAEEFQTLVIHHFAAEYKAGRTPNPCILCNEHLKFGTLLRRADELGAQFVATGHYARIELPSSVLSPSDGARSKDEGRVLLKRGRDLRKDQSYFLFSLRQEQLSRALFPLGDQTKSETRDAARHRKLKTAEQQESMEICFVPGNDYRSFLQKAGLAQKHRGEIVNLHGQVLGHHNGIEFYTIGQRKGLGLSSPKPLYVLELDAEKNRVVVGDDSSLGRDEFTVDRCNWIPFADPPPSIEVTVKIRYNHPGTPATVTPQAGGRARVKLHEPQRAITPGQAAVFYQDDLVVGGGWITR